MRSQFLSVKGMRWSAGNMDTYHYAGHATKHPIVKVGIIAGEGCLLVFGAAPLAKLAV